MMVPLGITISGDLTGCELPAWIPSHIKGTNFGVIDASTTFRGVGGTATTLYQVEAIDLAGTEVLTIDTTDGPVQIDLVGDGTFLQTSITLRDTAKIHHIRTVWSNAPCGRLSHSRRGASFGAAL